MSVKTNPAYGRKESWAAAIYVDGGKDILIQENKIENSPWALN